MNRFAPVNVGREWRPAREFMAHHRHEVPYVAVVLAGGYEEAGDRGRFHARAGTAVLHGAFEAHLDRFVPAGTQILNLRLPRHTDASVPFVRISDPDTVARLAETDPEAAVQRIIRDSHSQTLTAVDWPDLLGAELRAAPHLRLDEWSDRHGLAPATVSRGFRQVFGIPPAEYRKFARARAAWEAIVATTTPLAQLAHELGFADQAHMTRAVKLLTGVPPHRWRVLGRVKSVQDGRRSALVSSPHEEVHRPWPRRSTTEPARG